ncbi:hypothetical protein ACG7TL_002333 [Trametes sanguinea]
MYTFKGESELVCKVDTAAVRHYVEYDADYDMVCAAQVETAEDTIKQPSGSDEEEDGY